MSKARSSEWAAISPMRVFLVKKSLGMGTEGVRDAGIFSWIWILFKSANRLWANSLERMTALASLLRVRAALDQLVLPRITVSSSMMIALE